MGSRRQDYVARLRALDRSARFERRRERIEAARARRSRLRWAVIAGVNVLLAGGAVAGGAGVAGLIGALYGVGAVVLLLIVALVVRAVAQRRGARAWNWQTQRYSIIGNPSKQVHDADDRDTASDADLLPRPERSR